MTPEDRAEMFVVMHLPSNWFDDPHDDPMAEPARCCATRDALAKEIRAAVAEALEGTDLVCEDHAGYRLVWCNECVKIDREAWQKRVAEEREACAMVAEGWEPSVGGLTNPVYAANSIAAAIRARGGEGL